MTKKLLRVFPLTYDRVQPEQITEIGRYVSLPKGFHATNPAIVPFGSGYFVCVRGINYVLEGPRLKAAFTTGTDYMTVNRFLLLDRDFRVRRQLPELDSALDSVEDVKLFACEGQIMGSGSCPDPANGPTARAIGLLMFDEALRTGHYRLLPSPFGFRLEKNWAPFIHNGALHFVYSFEPLVIVRCDVANGTVAFADPAFARVRPTELEFLVSGSSPGLSVAGGFLFAAHRRRVSLPELRASYVTRMYFLDSDCMTLTAGRYFSIRANSIQFVNGLAEDNGHFILPYGESDRHAYLCRLDKDLLLRTFPSAVAKRLLT